MTLPPRKTNVLSMAATCAQKADDIVKFDERL